MSSKGLTAVAMLVAMVVLAQWDAACVALRVNIPETLRPLKLVSLPGMVETPRL